MSIEVKEIYRYPVKGLTPERLESVALTAGRCVPADRRYAIVRGEVGCAPIASTAFRLPYVTLTRTEKLAKLETDYDDASGVLSVKHGGRRVVAGAIATPTGRAMVEQFLNAFLGGDVRGKLTLLDSGDGPDNTPHVDEDPGWVSLIGLSSIRDLARVVGQSIDPRRFRGNIYFDGCAPWAELGWVGHEVRIGDVRLRVTERTERCAATNVDPDTAARDMNLPLALKRGFQHRDMGVYAAVLEGGTIAPGALVVPA